MTLSKKISWCAKKSNTKYCWGKVSLYVYDTKPSDSDLETLNYKVRGSHLVVKGCIGAFFYWCLFLFISNFNHHTGVNVLTHQLSSLCDVDGDLRGLSTKFVISLVSLYLVMNKKYIVIQYLNIDKGHSFLPGKSVVCFHFPISWAQTWLYSDEE